MNNTLHQPTITSMTIEVSVIRIGQKQMTLSVFDQLYFGKCYRESDKSYEIIYPLWGKVKKKGTEYAVFQVENELIKMEIPEERPMYTLNESIERVIDHKYSGYYLSSAHKLLIEMGKNHMYFHKNGEPDVAKFFDKMSKNSYENIESEWTFIKNENIRHNNMVARLKSSIQLFIAV